MKKSTFLIIVSVLISFISIAQIKLYLHKTDGSIIEYIAAEIDSITLGLYEVPVDPEIPDVPPVIPSDTTVVENVPFDTLMLDIYENLIGYVDRESYWGVQELTSDEMVVPTRMYGDWYDRGLHTALHNHDFESVALRVGIGEIANMWRYLMDNINKCDRLIAKIAKGELKDCTEESLAELYIYRSWFHYLMLDSFDDVQYNGNEISRVAAFDSIMSDLLTYVPKASKEKKYGRVNKYVGWMILSKMNLNAEAWGVVGKAKYASSAQVCYETSAAFADSIISKGGYSLEPDYFTNFKVENQTSKENIWSIVCEEQDELGLEFHLLTLQYVSQDFYGLKERPWNGFCTTHKVVGIYGEGDKRIATWERGQQFDKEGNATSTTISVDYETYIAMPEYVRKPYNWPQDLEAFQLMVENSYGAIAFEFPGYYTDTITTLTNNDSYKIYNNLEGPRFVKFEIQDGVKRYMSNDFPIYRLADVYLMKAEALIRANGGGATLEAVDAVNMVRSRAGASTYTTATLTLDELSNERCRELSWEGHRRQDLIRFNRFTGVNSIPNDNDPANLWILKDNTSDDSKKIFTIDEGAKVYIEWYKTKARMMVGEEYTFEVSVSGLDGVSWSSSDESIATVDDKGTVVALAVGDVKIYATYNGRTTSTTIEVFVPKEPLPMEDVPEVAAPTAEETIFLFQIENAECDDFELYLMGIDGNWDDLPEMKFERVEGTLDWFQLTIPAVDESQYNFKIRANGDWSYEPKCGYEYYGDTNEYVEENWEGPNNLMVVKPAGGKVLAFKVVGFVSICNEDYPICGDDDYIETPSDEEEIEDSFDYTASGVSNGYEYVDLGLPSGTLWATCNVGGATPLEYGSLFAWGETEPKDDYSVETYKWYGDDGYYVKYYGPDTVYGTALDITDNKTTLELADDAANANLGGDWRMPTLTELQELVEGCTWDWKSINGVKGFVVTGPSGNSIFLPAAGCSGYDVNLFGNYWSSTLDPIYCDMAYTLDIERNRVICDRNAFYLRYYGRSVRPVLGKKSLPIVPEEPSDTISFSVSGYENGYGYVDLGLPSGTLWATMNVGATTPLEYGYHLAWGEVYPKNTYNWSTYKWMTEGMAAWAGINKYTYPDGQKKNNKDVVWYDENDVFIGDNKKELDLEDDAASYHWGGDWRTPTMEQVQELKDNCIWTNAKLNDVNGCYVTSRTNGNSIFLPFAGETEESETKFQGSYGNLWTRSIAVYSASAYNVSYSDAGAYISNYYPRYLGRTIRPVLELEKEIPDIISYSIYFNANGGVGEMQAFEQEENTIFTIPENAFTRDDYEFIAWNTQADGTGASYSVNDVLTITSDITLYAQWKYIYQETGISNGYAYVDLGLSSGTLWATCNVGAENPEEYGDYFAWGETEAKVSYMWETYKYMADNMNSLEGINKYTFADGRTTGVWYDSAGNFIGDNKTVLDLEDDAANVNWGGNWRMPTTAEQQELMNNCTWIWGTKNGVDGYIITGSNGKTIFLPVPGYCYDTNIVNKGNSGYYWSSTLYNRESYYAYGMYLYNERAIWGCYNRAFGLSIRPVLNLE